MGFEWLPREEAAEALGVDVPTLQAWIDDGRAPSRVQGGSTQVLIEFEDDGEADGGDGDGAAAAKADAGAAAGDARSSKGGASNDNGKARRFFDPPPDGSNRDARHAEGNGGGANAKREHAADNGATPGGEGAGARRIDAEVHDVEVVARRELQLAGGMVAAWQRLAETADEELGRTRKLGVVAWSLVATLAVSGAVGIWWATAEVFTNRNTVQLTQHQLDELTKESAARLTRVQSLEAENAQLRTKLEAATSQLADATREASLAKAEIEKLAELQQSARSVATTTADQHGRLVEALQATIEQDRKRIEGLEGDAAGLRQELTETRRQLNDANSALIATGKELADARKELADAQAKLRDVEKQAAEQAKENDALSAVNQRLTEERDAMAAQVAAEAQRHEAAKQRAQLLEAKLLLLEADAAPATPATPPPAADNVRPETARPRTASAEAVTTP